MPLKLDINNNWKLLLITIMLLMPGMTLSAQDDYLTDNIERIVGNYEDFNGVIYIVQNGRILFNKAYNMADQEQVILIDVDSQFHVGSLVDQFTAIAVLTLHEDEALHVDDTICDYLADCSLAWKDITLHHLLTHTSGIPSYNSNLMDDLIDMPLDFEPGTEWNDSNSDYPLLIEIIESVSSRDYDDYLDETFFAPLGMKNTHYCNETTHNKIPPAEHTSTEDITIPCTIGLHSTAKDLAIWNDALYAGNIIDDTWSIMWERSVSVHVSTREMYGYGLYRNPIFETDEYVIGNSSQTDGVAASTSHFVNSNIDLIVLGYSTILDIDKLKVDLGFFLIKG